MEKQNYKEQAWERIEAVVKRSGMTVNGFAKHIGLQRGENLYQIKRGNNGISVDVANRICERFPDINKLWLLTGDGEMLGDMPNGPWSNIGSTNSEAFRAWAAAQILAQLIINKNCPDPYALAVEHAEKLQVALVNKHK